MRRTKQEGSINRIGDWWVLRYYERCLKDGKVVTMRRAKRLGLTSQYKTRKSAERLAEDVLRPVNEHSYEPETVTKLGEFVERVYLPYASEHLKPSTVSGYIDNWNNHLAAHCAEWWLRDVRTCDVQHVLDTLARENVIRRNDQAEVMLAERSLKNIKSLLSGIFKHAKQQGYFDGENPVRDSAAKSKAAPGEERLPYSLDEVRGMIRVLPEPAMTVVTVAAFTGLRRGELQACCGRTIRASN